MKPDPKTLIVEDSKAISNVMTNILADLGIKEIVTAENGLKGTEIFKNALLNNVPFELVFLDVEMPVMNGHTALKIMRTLEKGPGADQQQKAIIIMATSLDSPDSMIESIEGECNDYIVKPATINMIREKIAEYFPPGENLQTDSSKS
jgi:two-component system, chemotaxis family, chemotaxis protein CheY